MRPRPRLALLALLFLLGGALLRARDAHSFGLVLHILGDALLELVASERAAEVLVLLGSLGALVAAAPLAGSRGVVVGTAGALTLARVAVLVFPSAPVASTLLLDRSNWGLLYPECAVADDGALHVFVEEREAPSGWVVVEDVLGSERRLEPEALEGSLRARLAAKTPAPPVSLFVVESCPGARREAFAAAARRAADAARTSCRVDRLPSEAEVVAGWHAAAYDLRAAYSTLVWLGTAARLVMAAALALVALTLSKESPRALAGGLGLLALGCLLAAPVTLWSAVRPDAVAGCPSYAEAYARLGPYVGAVYASAVALALGGFEVSIGAWSSRRADG